MQNPSYENEFDLNANERVSETHFHMNCSFDVEAQRNASFFLNCTIGTNTDMDAIRQFSRISLCQEPATPIISPCHGVFTYQFIFSYFSCEIGQFQST